MSNNSYFTVAYKILSYLKYCYEHGESLDVDVLQAETFNISKKQFIDTLRMLLDSRYIAGIHFKSTKMGMILVNLQDIRVTIKGFQYLEENSMMKKAHKFFKEARDWLPLV